MNQQSVLIAPSILAADWARLGEEVGAVVQAGADWIHVDVMDNHYVPNLSMGPQVCTALRKHGVKVPLDVHLMVEPVDDLIKLFAEAGATSITIHSEATKHADRSLRLIRDLGCKAGVALNPASSLSRLSYIMSYLDIILVMAVNPGFSGQTFIPHMLEKIRKVRSLIVQSDRSIRLSVDGGVKLDNIVDIANAGADTFVLGSAIFGTQDYAKTIASLKQALGV